MKTISFALAMFAAVCIVMHIAGCAATCTVIDLANRACPLVVEYTDRTGDKRTVTVSNDDAIGLAAIKAARPDAGAP